MTLLALALACGGVDPMIAAGQDFPCALSRRGEAACWGSGQGGAIGALPGSYRWIDVGVWDVVAVTEDGALECHTIGGPELCDGAPTDGAYTAVSVSGRGACALREDGDAVCWDPTGDQREVPGPWTSLAVGAEVSCFAGGAGVTCDPGGAEPDGIVQVDVERRVACGIGADGAIACWAPEGVEVDARLLDAPEGSFVALDLGNESACAVDAEGALACWGFEGAVPGPPPGTWEQVGVGYGYACGVEAREIRCWGAPNLGGSDLTPPW